jgi:uncharacterized membrane protein
MSALRKKAPDYTAIRLDYTPKILLALEIFIANDLVKTIITPSLEKLLFSPSFGIRAVVGVSLNRELRDFGK